MIKLLEDKTELPSQPWGRKDFFKQESVGVQNESLQDMPLWHADYFALKTIKAQNLRRKLGPSPSLPKRLWIEDQLQQGSSRHRQPQFTWN